MALQGKLGPGSAPVTAGTIAALVRDERRLRVCDGGDCRPAAEPASPLHHQLNDPSPTVLPLQHPEASHQLLGALADVAVDMLVEQWRAGASILQVFESNAGELPPDRFADFALPYLRRIAEGVRARVPAVADGGPPLIVFARGAHFALEGLSESTAYDVIGLDWSIDPADANARVAPGCVVSSLRTSFCVQRWSHVQTLQTLVWLPQLNRLPLPPPRPAPARCLQEGVAGQPGPLRAVRAARQHRRRRGAHVPGTCIVECLPSR